MKLSSKKFKTLFSLIIFLTCSLTCSSKERETEIDKRLEKQREYRVKGWCSVPYNGDFYLAEILSIKDDSVLAKVLDSSLAIDDWPIIRFDIKNISPPPHKKCESLDDLISHLKVNKTLRTKSIEDAFRKIDRKWFCSKNSYFDAAIDIDCSMCISAPHMHVWPLELCQDLLANAENILDVGTGTGYMAAIFAQLCPKARVTGIDCFDLLIVNAKRTCSLHLENDLNQRLCFVSGNGELGYLQNAPYDIINVGFMCEEIPQCLIDQLKPGGRLIVPVGNGKSTYDERLCHGTLLVVNKKMDGSIEKKEVFSCSFVFSQEKKSHLSKRIR